MTIGVRIVDDPTPAGDGLPVMDVPVFVGFAARGPRDRPVAIDSWAGFEAVFGGLLDLVQAGRGEDPGERLTAHLYPAVAAFFAGGGRRCHVIRVAGASARSAHFAVPGLHLLQQGAPMWTLDNRDFALRASSPGVWADRLELSARVSSQALHAGDAVHRGDLLRARRPALPDLVAWRPVKADAVLTKDWASTGWVRPYFASAAVDPASWLIERVQLDLAVRAPGQAVQRLDGCGLAPGATRLPWLAPDADARFDAGDEPADWPLAGPVDAPSGDWALLPTGIGSDFDVWQPVTPDPVDVLERNGLVDYQPGLFLDPDWRPGLRGRLLMSWADEVRFFGDKPRRLRGLHGALGRDDACATEASWVIVPDAVHPGWYRTAPLPSRDVTVTTTPDPVCTCPPTTFDHCAAPPPVPPCPPHIGFNPDGGRPAVLPAGEKFTLRLLVDKDDEGAPQRLEVQMAGQPDFSDARVVLDSTVPAQLDIPTIAAGAWWLRARAYRTGLVSGWSDVAELDVRATGWRANPVTGTGVIEPVNKALLALGAASREHLALLALPPDWHERDIAGHVKALREEAAAVDTAQAASAASFAAIHHPWLLQRDADDRLRNHPPTGALMGLLARRSRLHGAWGAPGADPLPTALALAGEVQGTDALEALGLNPLALRADGIAAVRSQTLSQDADWTAIGVRRLFILLHRLCRREGQRFVFEPNDLTLRRGLERSFDALLHRLMQRGAFRGVDAASSYLLKTAAGADAVREIERGECSLLIQVAPSRPLRFLTLHLRRSGEQLLIEERS
jgi:hypothetical protein